MEIKTIMRDDFALIILPELKRLIVTNISQNMEKQVLSDTHWKHCEL